MKSTSITTYVPLQLPRFLLEPIVNRLCNGRLHEVDVAYDLRGENISNVAVKFAEAQTLCSRQTNKRESIKI